MTVHSVSPHSRIREFDLSLRDGGTLHVYDAGGRDSTALPLLWHHGTPNTGHPPIPLLAAAETLGLRWIGYDRPGYGGSTPAPDRRVSCAAVYAEAITDELEIDHFAVMGHSGGGPHALAAAALLPDRVVAAVAVASLAPFGPAGLEPEAYMSEMAASGVAALSAAVMGRNVKEAYENEYGADYDPEFSPGDIAMFDGEWSWFIDVVQAGAASGPAPAIDDDLAYVRDWGFDPASIQTPTLLLHGRVDRVVPAAHSQRLAEVIPNVELRLDPGAGHISVIAGSQDALAWVARYKE
ncbi:alpha/beta fold hydrolase [Salinibacterium sp. NK8237]|uniref:alpha/beta fold hydrolase n=1 Tax=Salinibacterium sp. NK8237 TaxID=2792038 RepID=UPI0018CF80C4|nr:alpha/beta hydrolase [Salinibacterium sp. NK8237]MBH0130913.1 alpha/beta hydrolase [Salinibacterium sp. NK8237]